MDIFYILTSISLHIRTTYDTPSVLHIRISSLPAVVAVVVVVLAVSLPAGKEPMCWAESAATPTFGLSTQVTVLPVANVIADVLASLDVTLEHGVVSRSHHATIVYHNHLGLHDGLLNNDRLLLHHSWLLLHLHRHLSLHLHLSRLLSLSHHHWLLLYRLLHVLLLHHRLLHRLLLDKPWLWRLASVLDATSSDGLTLSYLRLAH